MDLKQYFGRDDRGVSPVIGVILMVAITVILAAVIATFVMNMGPSQSTPANANWDFDTGNNTSSSITHGQYFELTHEGGGDAPAGEYTLSFENVSASDIPLDEVFDGGDVMSATDSVVIYNGSVSASPSVTNWENTGKLSNSQHLQNVTSVQLIWEDPEGDQSQTINTWDTDS